MNLVLFIILALAAAFAGGMMGAFFACAVYLAKRREGGE